MVNQVISELRQSILKIEKCSGVDNRQAIEKDSNKCFKRILVLCNYRERCCEELYRRIVIREKFDLKLFNSALLKAKECGIVDDTRYAEMYAFSKTQACRGIDGVIRHFKDMKIDYLTMPKVVEIINIAEENETSKAIQYLKNHPSHSKDQFSGNVKKLINRGFSIDHAINAAKLLIN